MEKVLAVDSDFWATMDESHGDGVFFSLRRVQFPWSKIYVGIRRLEYGENRPNLLIKFEINKGDYASFISIKRLIKNWVH